MANDTQSKVSVPVVINGIELHAMARVFSTGSRGFGLSGKVMIDGKMYQVGANLVEIGSKPKQ
jgi:hypothetical protein